MAALRERLVRIITLRDAKEYQALLDRLKRKGKRPPPASSLPGRTILTYEVIATSAPEATSGLFQPVGNYLTFIPGQVEDHLWQRIRTMDLPENREVWASIKGGMRHFGMFIRVEGVERFPAGLLELDAHNITPAKEGETIVRQVDKLTGHTLLVETSGVARRFPYLDFITRVWFPRVLYGSMMAREGRFKSTKRAQSVSQMFGIEVDTDAKKARWYTTATPDVLTDARRNVAIDEEAYQFWFQRIVASLELDLAEGRLKEPDWGVALERFRREVGVAAEQLVNRLRVDIAPIFDKMSRGEWKYEENPRRRARRHAFRNA